MKSTDLHFGKVVYLYRKQVVVLQVRVCGTDLTEDAEADVAYPDGRIVKVPCRDLYPSPFMIGDLVEYENNLGKRKGVFWCVVNEEAEIAEIIHDDHTTDTAHYDEIDLLVKGPLD